MTSRWLRSFLFLMLVYFSQVYPFYHLHHSHEDRLSDFALNTFSSEVETEHSADHHHDEDLPYTNNHQHIYDKHIDWHIVRTDNQRTLAIDLESTFFSVSLILTDDNKYSYLDYDKLPIIDEYNSSSLIIRGPPLLV